jgi:predicted transcriptional regulator YdeE
MMKIEPFNIIGIAVRTTNQNGQALQDLGKLWGQFFSEQIMEKIPNKISAEIYSIYTDYESDYAGKYTTIIGMKVSTLDTIPAGLVGRAFTGGDFKEFVAKGEMPKAVGDTWQEIWSKDKELNRAYTYDFEVYGAKSQNGDQSEVEIYIAVK